MLEFNILKGQYLNRLDKNVVSADTTDLKAQFELTADFTGTITVWWRRSDVDNTYTSTLAADGTCTIPAEALAATDKAVYGPYDHDVFVSISDTGRTTTNEYKLTVLRSAFSTTATPGTGGSPTAYEELVEQFDELKADNQTFKDSMTEQQETFESTVTENVDNIRYVVETETAPPIIEEASGAEITLDDSAYRQVRDLQLYGYSKQVTTTGAQLIKYPYVSSNGVTNNGITYTVSDNGVITANGTATDTSIFFIASELSDWRPSGEVFLSGCPSGGSPTTYRIQMFNYNGEKTFAIDNGKGAAANFTNADASWNLCIRIASGYTANNLVFKPMLNSGTSALPWEPYSGGYASPSPDWAQPIHSVADEVNLLETLTMDINTPSAEFPKTSNTLYVMLSPESGTSQVNICLRYSDGSHGQDLTVIDSNGGNGAEYPVFITPSKPCTGVFIYNVTSSAARTLSYGMVAISDTAIPYRPYGHNVTVRSAGANLFRTDNILTASAGGATVRNNDDGSLTISGAGELTSSLYMLKPMTNDEKISLFRGGTYRISGSNLGNPYLVVNIAKGSLRWEANTNNSSMLSVKFPKNVISDTSFVAQTGFYGFNGAEIKQRTVYPMFNRGSTPLPWQPYVAPSSALITLTDSLRGIPVTSGGNYTDESGQQWIADYIYRRQTDGKWMLWRNCGKVVYDGSEDEGWAKANNFFRVDKGSFSSASISGKGYSNYYKNITYIEGNSEGKTGFTVINDDVRIYNPTFSDVSSLTQWLSEHNTEIVYPIATPTIEELPDDVQTELNGLYTYNLHTDMWNNDGAYMNLKYVADTKTWINNKIAGLSTAMIENL